LGGRYQIIGQLGAGGFGQTFLAEDLHLPGNPRCVIKRLRPQLTDEFNLQIAKRLFDTEAKVLYQLGEHDQIPRLLAHFEHKQEFYLAQELIVGESLTEELIPEHPWSEAQVVSFLQDLLGVLAFVHEHGVIHRDIKPANLMRRRRDGKIILIDFGAVKQATVQLANPNSGPTQTIAIGTQGYMPNEQVVGNPRFSSDVYAVGMVALQALLGMAPRLIGEDPQTGELRWRSFTPSVNPQLAEILDRMVCYDFRARYPTAADAFAAIQGLLSSTDLTSEPLPSTTLPRPIRSPEVSIPSASAPVPSPQAETTAFWGGAIARNQASERAAEFTESPAEQHYSRQSPVALQTGRPSSRLSQSGELISAKWTIIVSQLNATRSHKVLFSLVGVAALGLIVLIFKPFSLPPSNPTSVVSTAPVTPTTASTSQPQPTDLLQQAEPLRQTGQFQKAIALYDQAIKLNSNLAEAYWGRCYSLNRLQQPAAAIVACDRALQLKPDYVEALWSKGYALDQQKQYQQALTFYERALALRPNFAEAWSNKGATLLKLNRPALALAALDRAVQIDPTLAEAWNNRGVALWSLRRFNEAIASVDRAIRLQPDYQDALHLRQQMQQRLNR
jgi:serine/threonine protein kinase